MIVKQILAGAIATAFLTAPVLAAAQDQMPAQPIPYSQLKGDSPEKADMKEAKADRKIARKERHKAHHLAKKAQEHAQKAIQDSANAQKGAVPAPPQ